jgi:hypothetical protein
MILHETYKYEVLAQAILDREKELFHYQFDLDNCRYIIERVEEGEYKEKLRHRIAAITEQMGYSRLTLEAFMSQVDDFNKLQEGLNAIRQK